MRSYIHTRTRTRAHIAQTSRQTDRDKQANTHMNDDVKKFTTAKLPSIEDSGKIRSFYSVSI